MKKEKLNFEKLELISDANLRTFKGGKSHKLTEAPVTANTVTIPGGNDDGDDGIKND